MAPKRNATCRRRTDGVRKLAVAATFGAVQLSALLTDCCCLIFKPLPFLWTIMSPTFRAFIIQKPKAFVWLERDEEIRKMYKVHEASDW